MDTNVKSTFLTTRAFLPYMIRNKSGSIINISSMWGQVGASCEVAYSATKAALIGLTKALAKELRDEVKNTLKKLQERFFGTLLETTMGQIKACKRPVDTLVGLTLEFGRRLQEKKQEKKILDFSDMEHYALEILFSEEEGKVYEPFHSHQHTLYMDGYKVRPCVYC